MLGSDHQRARQREVECGADAEISGREQDDGLRGTGSAAGIYMVDAYLAATRVRTA